MTTRLSDERLGELLGLIEDADSVELKLTVPHSDHGTVAGALGLDPLDAEIRQVYFFDTPDLSLSKGGLVVRARRVQGKGDDSVVKLRPVVPDQLPTKLRNTRGFGVEVDAMPGGFVCSASMKSTAHADVRETVAGARPLRKLFSREQRAFFAEHDPRPEREVPARGPTVPPGRRALAVSGRLTDPGAVHKMRTSGVFPGGH
jgi:hypothetical protein